MNIFCGVPYLCLCISRKVAVDCTEEDDRDETDEEEDEDDGVEDGCSERRRMEW